MRQETEYDIHFTAMVRRHEKIISSVCFFYSTEDVAFEDLRQEALISLFSGYKNFKGLCAESTWVYKVCINTCLFSLRKLAMKYKSVPLENLPEITFDATYEDDWKYKLDWLHSAISGLSPIDKALLLMWLDEMPYEDIASNMGIPRNTVASRLHRIKEKLSTRKDK